MEFRGVAAKYWLELNTHKKHEHISKFLRCRIQSPYWSLRPRTDVIISHQTLRKQTWRRAGNLKTRTSRIKTSSIQTSYRHISLKLKSIIKYALDLNLFSSRDSL